MKFSKNVLVASISAALLAMSGTAAASGFALVEQSGSGMGNAFAGGAAAAEDASTIFYNPAGMSRLPAGKQVAVALHAIRPSASFTDSASVAATVQAKGGTGGDLGSWGYVPNAYFAMDVQPNLKFGVGVNAPFGLQTSYDPTWMGRFQALKSKVQTINLNPTIAYQASDTVSLGVGLNYQRINGDLSNAVNYAAGVAGALAGSPAAIPAALAALAAAGQSEGVAKVAGNDAAWGVNLGALFNVSPQTRIGVSYRSKIKYNLNGTATFSANRPTAATLTPIVGAVNAAAIAAGVAAKTADGAINLAVTMPDSFTIGAFHQYNDQWDVMVDATRTGWSSLQNLDVVRSTGVMLSHTPENWTNTWRVSVGANHHYNTQWTARMGLAYDQTPMSDAFRTARIPDQSRTWLSLGGQYKPNKDSAFDFGYSHLFMSNASINQVQNTATGANGNLIGNYTSVATNILSAQYTRSF
jgi:long-chain fatty acid transport protein